jgi:hypothetical protein
LLSPTTAQKDVQTQRNTAGVGGEFAVVIEVKAVALTVWLTIMLVKSEQLMQTGTIFTSTATMLISNQGTDVLTEHAANQSAGMR